MRSVTSTRGRPSTPSGRTLETCHAAIGAVPFRFDAHERERLRDVVATRAHVGRAPSSQQHRARPIPMGLQVLFNQQVG